MSTFTALNGGSPRTSDPPVVTIEKPSPMDERPHNTAASQPPPTPEVSSNQIPPQSADRPSFQSPGYPDVEGAHKRKRSESVEMRREHIVHAHTPESAHPHHESREPYGTPSRDYRHYGDEHRDKESWYSHQARDERSYDSQQNSATTPHGQTEEQIGDALRRAAGHMDHGDYSNGSPDGDDSSIIYGGLYTSEARRDAILQHDAKKRKRNFSNRTKTGCLTCRKRKKKCDEQKPECEQSFSSSLSTHGTDSLLGGNCLRGSFVCAGYPPQRGPGWQKPDNKAAAVPLESKDPTYIPPGAYGMPQQSPYGSQPVKRESLPPYRGQALRIDPPQGRPLVTDDDRPTASTLPSASVASPENKLSALPYTPANVFPTPVSANPQPPPPPFGERMAKEYQRVPPLHDLSFHRLTFCTQREPAVRLLPHLHRPQTPRLPLSWLYRTPSSPRDGPRRRRCCRGDTTILSTRSFAWSVNAALPHAGDSTTLLVPLPTAYLPMSALACSSKFCSPATRFEFLPPRLPPSPTLAALADMLPSKHPSFVITDITSPSATTL
jgi:hypothetical protein